MSAFLGFESYLVPLGASPDDAKNTLKAALTSRGYRVIYESFPMAAAIGTLYTTTTYPQANAFDNDGRSITASTSALPLWLGAQASGTFTPTKLWIQADTTVNGTQAPNAFSLDWSDNGSSWNTLQSWSGETGWSPTETRSYTVSGAAAHAYWRVNVTAKNGGSYTSIASLRLENASGQRLSTAVYLVVLPPSGEPVGNAEGRDLLYIEFTGTYIRFTPVMESLAHQYMEIAIQSKTAGAVAGSLTINGVTVTGTTGSAGSTASDNLRALYEAIRASADPNFTDFTWSYSYPPAQGANDAYDYIFGTRKTAGIHPTYSVNANVTAILTGINQVPVHSDLNWPSVTYGTVNDVTCDLVNGFVYYLQVSQRGVALGTKTNTNYYGPIHAVFTEHQRALDGIPIGYEDKLIPVEILVGRDDVATGVSACQSFAYPSHVYGILPYTVTMTQPYADGNSAAAWMCGSIRRGTFFDRRLTSSTFDSANGWAITLLASGFGRSATQDAITDDYQLHRQQMVGALIGSNYVATGNLQGLSYYPLLDVQDWFKFRGTATNESLLLVADTVVGTTLNQDLERDDLLHLARARGCFRVPGGWIRRD